MKKKIRKTLEMFLCLTMLVQTIGCGYILYPERRGQTGGRIDAGVAVMDAVCLMLFVVPGVVAFAVDFASGTIYLPHTRGSRDMLGLQLATFDPKHFSNADIERIIKRETGQTIRLDQAGIQVTRLGSFSEMKMRLAELGNREFAVSLR